MMKKSRIIEEFDRYRAREIPLEDFENWVIAHLQEASESADADVCRLADEADVLLMELRDGFIDESKVVESMDALIDEILTTRTIDGEDQSSSRSEGQERTIHGKTWSSEQTQDHRLPPVVA